MVNIKNLIIWSLLILMSFTFVHATLYSNNETLLLWLELDNSSANFTDSKTNNLPLAYCSYNGALQQQQKLAPNGTYALDFDGTDDLLYCGNQDFIDLLNGANSITFNFWIAWSDPFGGADKGLFSCIDTALADGFRVFHESDGSDQVKMITINDPAAETAYFTYAPTAGTDMVTIVHNASFNTLYINGAKQQSIASALTSLYDCSGAGAMFTIASNNLDKYSNRKTDEFSIWNTSLSGTDITELFNNGIVWVDTSPPPLIPVASFIVPPTPADGVANNTLGSNITATCTYNGEPIIYFSKGAGAAVEVVANATGTGLNITSWLINSSFVAGDGTYYYNATCSNASSIASAVRTWIYDTTEPPININPNTFFYQNNLSNVNQYNESQLLRLNFTVTDTNDLYGVLINITRLSTGVSYYSYLNQSLTGSTSWNYNRLLNHSTYPADSNYLINIWAADSHTNNIICPLTDDCYKPKQISNGIDFLTAEGNHIWLTSEEPATFSTTQITDRYKININFTDGLEKKRVLNVYSDKPIDYLGEKSGYLAHFIIWNNWVDGGNWLDFEADGLNILNTKVKKISDYHFKITFDKLKDVTFNSIGGMNINHKSFSWYKGKTAKTAPTAVSGNSFTMVYNITTDDSILDINAGLTYNGTYYSATESNGTGFILFQKSLNFIVLTDFLTNYTWNVTVRQNETVSYSFGDIGEHTIYTLLIDNCSISPTTTANFLIRDEEAVDDKLNATFEIDATYYSGAASTLRNLTYRFTGNSDYSLCLYPNVTFYMDAYIKYTTENGFTHRYYLINESLTKTAKNFYLYNYNRTAGISDLKITLRRINNYAYYPNIYGLLQRLYVDEGVWRTVQMDKSGDFGQLFYNIIEENTDYRLIYWDSYKNILSTTNSLKFVCTSGLCDITQKLSPYSATTSNLNTSFYILFDNATNKLNVSWNNPKAISSIVNITITRETFTGIQQLCSYSAFGAAGFYSCDTAGYSGTFLTTIYENGAYAYSEYSVTDDENLADFISAAEGAIWVFAIMVTIIMFGLFSPVGSVIATLLGLILVFVLGIFNAISLTFVIVACILGIAIGLKVRS